MELHCKFPTRERGRAYGLRASETDKGMEIFYLVLRILSEDGSIGRGRKEVISDVKKLGDERGKYDER